MPATGSVYGQSEGLSMAWLQFCKDILPTKLALTAKKVVPNPFLFICMAGNLSPLGMPDGVKQGFIKGVRFLTTGGLAGCYRDCRGRKWIIFSLVFGISGSIETDYGWKEFIDPTTVFPAAKQL